MNTTSITYLTYPTTTNPCAFCQWNGAYWSVINPCQNCPNYINKLSSPVSWESEKIPIRDYTKELELTKKLAEVKKENERLKKIIKDLLND